MLKLIKCTPRSELYRKAFERKVQALTETIKRGEVTVQDYMPIIFLGVKSYVTSRMDKEAKSLDSLMARHYAMEVLKRAMALLTPRQFMYIFPVTKDYKGAKYECKDYFYTMDMIKKMEMDAPIGDRINDFLWDYQNRDIRLFLTKIMGVTSDILRAQGEPGLMEHMSAEFGIPFYVLDGKNKQITGPVRVEKMDDEYYYNESEAQSVPYKKRLPDYLKVVEGNQSTLKAGERR